MLPVFANTLVNIILVVSSIVFALFNWILKPSIKTRILTIAVLSPLSLAIYALPRLAGSGLDGFMDDMTNLLAWIVSFVCATTFTVAASATFWISGLFHRWYTKIRSVQKGEITEIKNPDRDLPDSNPYQPPNAG